MKDRLNGPDNGIQQRLREQYRERRLKWHKAVAAYEQVEELPRVTKVKAEYNMFMKTRSWVRRLLTLDSVHDLFEEIWHEEEFGEHTGLLEWYEEEPDDQFRTSDGVDTSGLDIGVVYKAGKVCEHMMVEAYDFPEQPPVDVEPWQPPTEKEQQEFLDEIKQDPEVRFL